MKKRIKLSLASKFSIIIMLMSFLIGLLVVAAGFQLYLEQINSRYIRNGHSTITTASSVINWDGVSNYATTGIVDEAYEKTLEELRVCAKAGNVEYIFVIIPQGDKCLYVFDTDTGEDRLQLGETIEWYEPFKPYQEKLNAGEKIDPLVTNEEYGWLLSLYVPFADSSGNFVGYLGVDYPVNHLVEEQQLFVSQLAIVSLVVALLMTAVFLIILRVLVLSPVEKIAKAASAYLGEASTDINASTSLSELEIKTHDELQTLAESLKSMEQRIRQYINRLESETIKAESDSMTGTLNREAFVRRVEQDLHDGNFEGYAVFMMIDLDRFKSVNDTYGHNAGDEVIIRCVEIIKSKFRSDDYVGRMGGDEFAVFYKGAQTVAEIEERIASICEDVRSLQFEGSLHATVSIGAVIFSAEVKYTYNGLYVDADQVLYLAKEAGRDGYRIKEVPRG